jgi:lysophospholipase L1-like esterase
MEEWKGRGLVVDFLSDDNIILTAIGDSITVGVGSPLLGKGYVRRYAAFTEETFNKPLAILNYAKTGSTSMEILEDLKRREVELAVRKAKIITISAGGNDLIQAGINYYLTHKEDGLQKALYRCKKNVGRILDRIYYIKKETKESYIIRMCNLYNPYYKIRKADHWVNRFNEHLKHFESLPNLMVADLYSAFKGREKELISWDSIHPNGRGYQVIAVVLFELGYSEI